MKYFTTRNLEAGRQKGIDFLRGIAILLVMVHHFPVIPVVAEAGWIGVDLFFVISGFLVSGLLFQEYLQYNTVRPGRFLIRRGFKIYPLFYVFTILTLLGNYVAFRATGREVFLTTTSGIWGEVFFLQNYWSALWVHTWSLAVEEHFYFMLAALLFFIATLNTLHNIRLFLSISGFVLLFCLSFRIYLSVTHSEFLDIHYTHLRVDSLMYGVLIGYFYHFRKEQLTAFVTRYKMIILLSGLLLISPCFFLELKSTYMVTAGFSLLAIGFGEILLLFLILPQFVQSIRNILTDRLFTFISRIGFYSYSIYLFHLFVKRFFVGFLHIYFPLNIYVSFIAYAVMCLFTGFVVARIVEVPFLNLRDHYFPKFRGVKTALTQQP